MLHSLLRFSAAIGILSLTACSSGDDDSSAAGGTGGSGATGGSSGSAGMSAGGSAGMMGSTCSKAIVASPDQNYQFSSSLTINMTEVKPSSEITFDWSKLTTDFLKKPVDLNTIDMVEVALWKMGLSDFEKNLNDDTLDMQDVEIIAWIDTTTNHQTTDSIFKLQVPNGPVDMATILNYLDINSYPPGNHIYTAMVANGSDLGKGTRMLQGFELNATSTNTQVNIDSSSTQLAFKATIASRPVTNIPGGTPDVTIDWTKMMVTAAGGEFLPQQITQIRVGSYTQTPAELEGDNFLKLDELATDMYSSVVDTGTSINFNKTMTKDGKAFAGIEDTHTWIVALNCGGCQNPAPWYLSVLKSCAASP